MNTAVGQRGRERQTDSCASTHTNAIYWNPAIIQLIGAVGVIIMQS